MFAGVSNGVLFCMGGANFPDKNHGREDKKKWYDEIYMLESGKEWKKLSQKMPAPLGYGVSISYQNSLICIGGNDEQQYSDLVTGYTWKGDALEIKHYPSLPMPLANMAGTIVDHLILIAGGHTSPVAPALNQCLALDLEAPEKGWFEMDPIPGRERLLPVSASYQHEFFVFGGETVLVNDQQEKRDGF